MTKRWIRSVGVGLTLLLGLSAFAADWPEFRGPTGQGIVPAGRLPVEWGPQKNIAWRQLIPGAGWSSPVVVKGRIYLTTAMPRGDGAAPDQSLEALCLDARTGAQLWETEIFRQQASTAPPIHGKNSHASPTPVVRDDRLYVHFGHVGTACLDLAGKVLWRSTRLNYVPVHGNGGSPILADAALIFSGDGRDEHFVAALDRNTGEVLWKTERTSSPVKKFSFSTPLLIEANGHKQVISAGSDEVAAYDPRTGREIWRVRYTGYSVVPRPAFGAGLVFLSTGYDSPQLLAIRADGAGDVTDTHIAWRARRAAPLTPSPLVVGDELYLLSDNGVASCLDARSGKVHWQQRVSGSYSASPIWADSKLYFLSEDGTGVVVRADKRFELLARNPLKERTLASPAAADGALFIRTDRHLYRIQQR